MVSLIKIDFLVFLWYNSLIYNKEEKLLGTLEGFLGFGNVNSDIDNY